MPKIAPTLTEAQVRKLKTTTTVGGVTGLVLVMDKGKSSWILRYNKLSGQRGATGLGAYPSVLAEAARAKARKVLDDLANGIEPDEMRQERKATAVAAKVEKEQTSVTFKDCAYEKWELLRLKWRKNKDGTDKKNAAQWINTLTQYAFPFIGEKFCRDITKADIKAILEQPLKDEPGARLWWDKFVTAQRVQQRVAQVLAHAIGNDLVIGNNVADYETMIKPMGFTVDHHKPESHASMPYKEVPLFMQYLDEHNRKGCGIFATEFLVLTVARSGNVYGATWGQMDLEADQPTWHIPADVMKMERALTFHFPSKPYLLLEVRAHLVAKDIPVEAENLVFPSVSFIAPTNKNYGKMLSNSAFPTRWTSTSATRIMKPTRMGSAPRFAIGARSTKSKKPSCWKMCLRTGRPAIARPELSYLDMQVYFERRIPVMNQWADFIRPRVAQLRAVA